MRQQRQQKRHRYVLEEPHIPFECEVLYENDAIIVVDKPHFLATTPRGMWYRETALIRLREQYGEPDIVPAHRLDRLTAGNAAQYSDRNHRPKSAIPTNSYAHATGAFCRFSGAARNSHMLCRRGNVPYFPAQSTFAH